MYSKTLVPLDGSELAECVLPHLESIATGCGVGEVTLLRVVEPEALPAAYDEGYTTSVADFKRAQVERKAAAEKYLKDLVGRLKHGSANVKTVVVSGKPADSIADYATKHSMDLIIIATHGRSGVSRWFLGSVADRIVRSACVPVLMVRAPGCMPGI